MNPEDHNLSMEERFSLPYIDCVHNTETLFNLTATSPQKSPRQLQSSHTMEQYEEEDPSGDGVVNLSPFKSRMASKERAHRLITNIFELELDSLRQTINNKSEQGGGLAGAKKKKFSIKELAYNFNKKTPPSNIDVVRNELIACRLEDKFTNNTNWRDLLKILKEDEKDNRFFTPVTDYDLFKWGAELEE